MTTGTSTDQGDQAPKAQSHLHRVPAPAEDEGFADPTAGMVLHRVLAGAARTFLLNDMGAELSAGPAGCERGGPLDALMRPGPLWAQSAAIELDGHGQQTSQAERVHQSRVAMRRIRSNLRTFHLLVDPKWGTSLRAELAWYGNRLGEVRDLHIMQEVIADHGPDAMDPEDLAELDSEVAARMEAALASVEAERGGACRFQLTEQMMVLWDGPSFRSRAAEPAGDVLPALLHRAWHDLRGAARTARKKPTDEGLHKLRIRLKDLRYGCNTVALVEGGPARKTGKAAERLQTKLGDLHDACFSIEWLRAVATERPDLADPVDSLVARQQAEAKVARRGWKAELKVVERRWRRWHP